MKQFNPNYRDDIKIFTEKEVEEALHKLKPKKTLGPDNIPPYTFKDCRKFLSFPLCFIFNKSLEECKFPAIRKISKITPIPKTKNGLDISNFRPILILKVSAKIFETLIYKKIFPLIKNQISLYQHGFYGGRSVVTNLLIFVDKVAKTLDRGWQMDMAYTDFQKAFNRLDHSVLKNKLKMFGFSEKLISLFKSYLSERRQYVMFKGVISALIECTFDVPQGSNLGPLLQ